MHCTSLFYFPINSPLEHSHLSIPTHSSYLLKITKMSAHVVTHTFDATIHEYRKMLIPKNV
jgi:hypothetical protein